MSEHENQTSSERLYPETLVRVKTERDELKVKLADMTAAEHATSDAYLRISKELGGWDTPYAPTSEQIYEQTEAKLQELKAKLENRDSKCALSTCEKTGIHQPFGVGTEGCFCFCDEHAQMFKNTWVPMAKLADAEKERNEARLEGVVRARRFAHETQEQTRRTVSAVARADKLEAACAAMRKKLGLAEVRSEKRRIEIDRCDGETAAAQGSVEMRDAECAVLREAMESAIVRMTAARVFPPDAGHPMIQRLVDEFDQALTANVAGAKALAVVKAAKASKVAHDVATAVIERVNALPHGTIKRGSANDKLVDELEAVGDAEDAARVVLYEAVSALEGGE